MSNTVVSGRLDQFRVGCQGGLTGVLPGVYSVGLAVRSGEGSSEVRIETTTGLERTGSEDQEEVRGLGRPCVDGDQPIRTLESY